MREKTLVEAVASSLTELFAPKIHKERISGMLENYDFISDDVMQYFKRRLTQAPGDADFALDYVKRNARTPEAQAAALDALRFKCSVLWAQLDALHYAYVEPGLIPARRVRAGQSMNETSSPARLIVGAETRPHLPAYLKLRHDAGRGRWIVVGARAGADA